MTHRQKVDRLIAELGKKGVNQYTVAPPLFRLLWALGLNVPPPFFLSFATLVLTFAPLFGIPWGGFMWLFAWQGTRLSMEVAIITSALAGVFFGVTMAGYYCWKARQLNLPAWEDHSEGDGGDPLDDINAIVNRKE
jgi:hypothetical protein